MGRSVRIHPTAPDSKKNLSLNRCGPGGARPGAPARTVFKSCNMSFTDRSVGVDLNVLSARVCTGLHLNFRPVATLLSGSHPAARPNAAGPLCSHIAGPSRPAHTVKLVSHTVPLTYTAGVFDKALMIPLRTRHFISQLNHEPASAQPALQCFGQSLSTCLYSF